MKSKRKWIIGVVMGLALAALSVLPAMAMYVEPAMIGMNTGKIVRAGMSDLPLRDGQGTTSGIVEKLKHGQQLTIWWNDGEGWAYVEASPGKFGWVCLANTY